jgi:hypothetical protein
VDSIIFDVSLVSFLVLLVGLMVIPERHATAAVIKPVVAGA